MCFGTRTCMRPLLRTHTFHGDADDLAENKLESMYLGWNLIDHVGFGAIIDATGRQHSKLKLINLRNNKISRCSSGNSIRQRL